MAQPFFGRRDPEPARSNASAAPANVNPPAASMTSGAAPAPSSAAAVPGAATASPGGGSKLTVGPNIKLKGVEITDCDTLLVEGTVEATMNSRVIEIARHGTFKGAAEIDVAEIHGSFEGSLTVRQKLVIHGTGQVTGQVRYGKLVIEEGGQLCGDVQSLAGSTASPVGNAGVDRLPPPQAGSGQAPAGLGRVLPSVLNKTGLHVAG